MVIALSFVGRFLTVQDTGTRNETNLEHIAAAIMLVGLHPYVKCLRGPHPLP